MSEPGDAEGWAPLDPDLPTGRSPEPHPGQQPPQPPRPPEQQQHPRQPQQAFPQQPQQPPAWGQEYGAPQHPQAPYPQPPYPQAPYAPGPHGQEYGAYGGYGPPPVKRDWKVDAPKGSPFHRLARTDVHRWWRPLVGTLAIAAAGMGLALGLMIIGMIVRVAVTGDLPESSGPESDTIFGDETADLAFNLAALAVFLPVALLAAWGIQRRRPGTLSSVAGRLRWRWMLACSGLAILFCVVSYGTSILAGVSLDEQSDGNEQWVGWGDFILPAVVIVLLVPFQATAEEYVFRGWMLQAVGACTLEKAKRRVGRALSVVFRTPWPGIVVGSALFTSGHGYTGWGILDIFAFGAIAAWLAVKTGGLESGIALHVFNNLMAFLLPAAVGELDIEQGGVPWQVVVADVVPMALYAAAVVWLARRMRVQTVTTGPEDEDDVPVAAEPQPTSIS
ncbi:CPBP family intramembrane metalloprotease [Actinomadura sp. KC06]|uniref:CPBP family glutamic-type intramembrane protease n=1 Tax=Actinomadura sp. KC06 TaxID=2530369 RepID=UPI001051BCC2|nr:CPBP family glutamic-type intramembrane protease [Actinomadura sp. KC06]TDD38030.1 CPBP family intramembrane metalloprotease [Actinomadura sp. KC06]